MASTRSRSASPGSGCRGRARRSTRRRRRAATCSRPASGRSRMTLWPGYELDWPFADRPLRHVPVHDVGRAQRVHPRWRGRPEDRLRAPSEPLADPRHPRRARPDRRRPLPRPGAASDPREAPPRRLVRAANLGPGSAGTLSHPRRVAGPTRRRRSASRAPRKTPKVGIFLEREPTPLPRRVDQDDRPGAHDGLRLHIGLHTLMRVRNSTISSRRSTGPPRPSAPLRLLAIVPPELVAAHAAASASAGRSARSPLGPSVRCQPRARSQMTTRSKSGNARITSAR